MPAVPDAVDHLLIPLDPARALSVMAADFERFVKLDPRIKEAGQMMAKRFESVTTYMEVLESALWVHMRDRMRDPVHLAEFRRALGDPDVFLRAIEYTLDNAFTESSLRKTAEQAQQMSQADSPAGRQLAEAREEIDRAAGDTDAVPFPPFGLAILIACACAAVCYCIAAAIHYLAS